MSHYDIELQRHSSSDVVVAPEEIRFRESTSGSSLIAVMQDNMPPKEASVDESSEDEGLAGLVSMFMPSLVHSRGTSSGIRQFEDDITLLIFGFLRNVQKELSRTIPFDIFRLSVLFYGQVVHGKDSGEYEWFINSTTLDKMCKAKNGGSFKSPPFEIAGLLWRMEAEVKFASRYHRYGDSSDEDGHIILSLRLLMMPPLWVGIQTMVHFRCDKISISRTVYDSVEDSGDSVELKSSRALLPLSDLKSVESVSFIGTVMINQIFIGRETKSYQNWRDWQDGELEVLCCFPKSCNRIDGVCIHRDLTRTSCFVDCEGVL